MFYMKDLGWLSQNSFLVLKKKNINGLVTFLEKSFIFKDSTHIRTDQGLRESAQYQ